MGKYGAVGGPFWSDRPVAIVGGGPSLVGFDFESLRGLHVLAIKGAIFDIPWADAGLGIDYPRLEEWRGKLPTDMRIYWAVPDDKIEQSPEMPNLTYLRRVDGAAISSDPEIMYSGGTSGFAGLQLAAMKRAKVVGLFGFDYRGNFGLDPENFRHNDRHYAKRRAQDATNWSIWAGYFTLVKPVLDEMGIEVINACETSAIGAFPKMRPEAAVKYLQERAGNV